MKLPWCPFGEHQTRVVFERELFAGAGKGLREYIRTNIDTVGVLTRQLIDEFVAAGLTYNYCSIKRGNPNPLTRLRQPTEGSTMQQVIEQIHSEDEDGRPAGGSTHGKGITIVWQNGPLGVGEGERLEPNGAFVEGVVQAALGRLEYYQSTAFRCRENALAITKLEEALLWLGKRTADRVARGVEGTHVV